MPFPGTRVNQETVPLNAAGMSGVASYYEVKFTDTNKPNGQIWAGVVGAPTPAGTPRGQRAPGAVVRRLARHRHQPGAQGRGRHARAVHPAVGPAAASASAAAGPERTATPTGPRPTHRRRIRMRHRRGRPSACRFRSHRRRAGDVPAARVTDGSTGRQGPTYGTWPLRLLTLSR